MNLDEAKTEYLQTRDLYSEACKLGRIHRNRRWDAYSRMKDAEINLIDVAMDTAAARQGESPLCGDSYEAMLASPTARRQVAELSLRIAE